MLATLSSMLDHYLPVLSQACAFFLRICSYYYLFNPSFVFVLRFFQRITGFDQIPIIIRESVSSLRRDATFFFLGFGFRRLTNSLVFLLQELHWILVRRAFQPCPLGIFFFLYFSRVFRRGESCKVSEIFLNLRTRLGNFSAFLSLNPSDLLLLNRRLWE